MKNNNHLVPFKNWYVGYGPETSKVLLRVYLEVYLGPSQTSVIEIFLTHFRPMFHLRINQVVGFKLQNIWKTPVEGGILSKDAGHRPASLLKISLFHMCFSNISLLKTNYLVSS